MAAGEVAVRRYPWLGLAICLVIVALFAMASAWEESLARTSWMAVSAFVLVSMAVLDFRFRRVPNAVVYPSLAAAVLVPALAGQAELLLALQGGAIAFALMLLLALIGRGSMGMADVKVAALCGLLLGPQLVIAAITVMTVTAAGVALLLMVTRRAGFGSDLPLVPFMAATTMVFLANGSAVL